MPHLSLAQILRQHSNVVELRLKSRCDRSSKRVGGRIPFYLNLFIYRGFYLYVYGMYSEEYKNLRSLFSALSLNGKLLPYPPKSDLITELLPFSI